VQPDRFTSARLDRRNDAHLAVFVDDELVAVVDPPIISAGDSTLKRKDLIQDAYPSRPSSSSRLVANTRGATSCRLDGAFILQ